MSYKRIFYVLIGGFIALLLMSTNIEVTADSLLYTDCPAGQYGDVATNSCVDAAPGYYVPEPNMLEQFPCLPGTYQPNSGAIACIVASPGHFVDTMAATAQIACAPGAYQPVSAAVSCILADPGHFVDTSASAVQIACSPGTYQPAAGAINCIAADPGYYVPASAATEQLPCPAGTTSSAAATECTPIPTGYTFSGFLQPVDNLPTVNVVKAGQAIPVKFSLGGDFGLGIMAAGYPASTAVACDTSAPSGDIEETASAGNSSLSYNADTDTYTYVWKTNKAWSKSCRILTVVLDDGSVHQASFNFTR